MTILTKEIKKAIYNIEEYSGLLSPKDKETFLKATQHLIDLLESVANQTELKEGE